MTQPTPTNWSGAQFKAARVWVGLTHEQLSSEAGVGLATVRRVEVSSDLSKFRQTTISKIQSSLAEKGAVFSARDKSLILGNPTHLPTSN